MRKLDRIVNEMVERGVHFTDAQREFERCFIARVAAHCDGNVGKAAEALGRHRNDPPGDGPQNQGPAQPGRLSRRSVSPPLTGQSACRYA